MSTRPTHGDLNVYQTLNEALSYLHYAAFEVQRGHAEAGLIWIEDLRGALGRLALGLSEQSTAAEGYLRLATAILTHPRDPAAIKRERQVRNDHA